MKIETYNTICDVPDIPYVKEFKDLFHDLEKTNPCRQKYHLLVEVDDFAFFCEYRLNLNIFTYNKLKLNYPVRIIGIPASVGTQGFYATSAHLKKRMYEYISTFKGASLVLNTFDNESIDAFGAGQTLPTHILYVKWNTLDEYLSSMRSNYRYRLKKALRNNISIRKIDNKDFDDKLYSLYLNVYKKSSFKLEKLSKSFFQQFGEIIVLEDKTAIAFIQIYKKNSTMYFMFCGIDYEYNNVPDLYYMMLFEVIKRGIKEKVEVIDLGQTTSDTKTKLGAVMEKRYMHATHSNKLIRSLVIKHMDKLSYNEEHKNYNVMKSR